MVTLSLESFVSKGGNLRKKDKQKTKKSQYIVGCELNCQYVVCGKVFGSFFVLFSENIFCSCQRKKCLLRLGGKFLVMKNFQKTTNMKNL